MICFFALINQIGNFFVCFWHFLLNIDNPLYIINDDETSMMLKHHHSSRALFSALPSACCWRQSTVLLTIDNFYSWLSTTNWQIQPNIHALMNISSFDQITAVLTEYLQPWPTSNGIDWRSTAMTNYLCFSTNLHGFHCISTDFDHISTASMVCLQLQLKINNYEQIWPSSSG